MTDAPKPTLIAFEVPWVIEGRRKVYATSPEAAEAIFQAMEVADFAEEGELQNFPAEVIEEE